MIILVGLCSAGTPQPGWRWWEAQGDESRFSSLPFSRETIANISHRFRAAWPLAYATAGYLSLSAQLPFPLSLLRRELWQS